MRLIVTEKNNTAKKIADILSGGDREGGRLLQGPRSTHGATPTGEHMTVGLKGHVLNPAFPEGYSNWQKTDPRDADRRQLIKEPTDKNVVKAIKKLAKDADSVVIATDFDREGELIGLEALQRDRSTSNPTIVAGRAPSPTGPPVKRARYSALTKEEIERAFTELDELSYALAHAGAARQDIDLIWGATLTRAVSLATRRFGSNFLSVGRVQSPTLGLIVERELERRAHVAKPFWEVFAKFAHPDGHVRGPPQDRQVLGGGRGRRPRSPGTKSPGKVTEITAARATPASRRRRSTRPPSRPTPPAAWGSPRPRAMRIAEDLYMDGFISYPRTDNTVYPPSLTRKRAGHRAGADPRVQAAQAAARRAELTPTRGKKETTDHPPIYPTQARLPERARGPQAPRLRAGRPPLPRDLLAADDHRVDARRHRGRRPRPTSSAARSSSSPASPRSTPTPAPPTTRSRSSRRARSWSSTATRGSVDKETQPPSRISQGKLIEMMEERGLGTKATRADIIQKLYDRGYVYSNPPEPSETGIAMYKAFKDYVPRMATPEMTAELEADMDKIAAGQDHQGRGPADQPRDAARRPRRTSRHKREDLRQGDLGGDGRGQDPRPLQGLRGGRAQARGRLAEPAADHRAKGGKRFVGCEG